MSETDIHSQEARDLQAIMRMKGRSDHERIRCMSGAVARDIQASYETDIRPDVGEYCMLHLEDSAAAERDPQALQQRPDMALLAPYQRIAADKGLEGDKGNAQAALGILARGARDARSADTIGPARFPLASGQDLVLVPGVAWDVGFTSTMLAAQRGQSQPAATMPRHIQIEEAARCFTNAQQSIQACYAGGVQQARAYLAQPKLASTPTR